MGQTLGTPAAASNSVADNGSSRTPVCRAVSPSATERNRGTTKNNPPWRRYWKKKIVRPPRNWRLSSMAGSTNGSAPRATWWRSQARKPYTTVPPASTSHTVAETPNNEGAPGLACTQPQALERSTPKTNKPRPAAESTVPTRSRWGRCVGGASATLRASTSMAATTRTSPTKTHRHERYVVTRPPISGPAATAIAPADITRPNARGRSEGAKLEATRATMAGRISTAPMPSRNDHPKIKTPTLGASDVVTEPQP